MSKNNDFNRQNYYGEFPTAHIDARYENGQFVDLVTQEPIALKAQALVRIIVYRKDILQEEQKQHFQAFTQKVLSRGEILLFEMPTRSGRLVFALRLLEDLQMKKEGNKSAKVLPCSCEVFDIEKYDLESYAAFEPIVVQSLNQAFFQMSTKYRPENASHVANIYKHFHLPDSTLLENLRF